MQVLFRCESVSTCIGGSYALACASGTITGIRGPSGSGKSLLLRALADVDPSQGQVWLNDQDRQSFTGPAWRSQVRYVAAESAWWDKTAALCGVDPKIAEAFGLRIGICDEPIVRCSSGERQRLSLARAVSDHPQVVLCDEPTANLDSDSATLVERWMHDWVTAQPDRAVVWVGHAKPQQPYIFDRWLMLKDGGLQLGATP